MQSAAPPAAGLRSLPKDASSESIENRKKSREKLTHLQEAVSIDLESPEINTFILIPVKHWLRDVVASACCSACSSSTTRIVSKVTVIEGGASVHVQCEKCYVKQRLTSDTLGTVQIPKHFKANADKKKARRKEVVTESKSEEVPPAKPSALLGRPTQLGLILAVLSCIFAGIGYTAYSESRMLLNVTTMDSHTFDSIMQQLGMTMRELSNEVCLAYRTKIKAAGKSFVWVSDMGWSHRGYTAFSGCYPVVNGKSKKRKHLCCFVMSKSRWVKWQKGGKRRELFQGNYIGSSKGMEVYCVGLTRDMFKDEDILKLCECIVMDNDSSAAKYLRVVVETEGEGAIEIIVCLDPNHYCKNR